MHPTHSYSRATTLACFLLTALVVPSVASAQKGSERNFTLAYAPGSASRNGYADAQLHIQYWFAACPGAHVLVRVPSSVHMLVGNHRYWYQGKLMEVPPTIAPPAPEKPAIKGTVRGNGIAVPITYNYASTSPTCGFNGAAIAQPGGATPWPKGASDDEKIKFLNQYGFDIQQTLGVLRSAAVENHFREQIAEARRDSAQRAQARRSDSLQRVRAQQIAARDSVARAATGAGGAPVGTGSATADAGSTFGSGGMQDQGETIQRDTARENAARRQREAREAQEAVARRFEEERARTEAIEAAATDVAGMFAAAWNEDQARKRASEERARAALEAYQARVAAAFAAMPARPRCTPSDVVAEITVDVPLGGSVDGSECRMADQNSAETYTLRLATRQRIEVFANASFYRDFVVTSDAGVVAKGENMVQAYLDPGTYRVTMHTRYPGETGNYTLTVGRGTYSNAQGAQMAFFVDAGSASIEGGPEFAGNFAGLRFGVGSSPFFKIVGEFYGSMNDDSFMSVEAGLRSYFGSRHSRLRPYLHGTYGYRDINQITMSLDGYQADGQGYTVGVGADWFMSPRASLEFGVFSSSGMMNGAPLTSTRLRIGMAAHRSRCGWTCD